MSENKHIDAMFRNYPDVVNSKQFQQMIGVSKKTAYCLLKKGYIECRKVGREYKIPKINIINYLLNN
jgi:predicted site-specific integrase-resolvase